jgi:hypothetical protein
MRVFQTQRERMLPIVRIDLHLLPAMVFVEPIKPVCIHVQSRYWQGKARPWKEIMGLVLFVIKQT